MSKLKKVFIGIFVGFLCIGLIGLFFATRGLEEGKNVVISEVNFSQLDDGLYIGIYNHGRWTNQVELRVENHKLIEIKKIEGFEHKEALDMIHERVLENQSLSVDLLSGATVSSKAYLKSIENALQGDPIK